MNRLSHGYFGQGVENAGGRQVSQDDRQLRFFEKSRCKWRRRRNIVRFLRLAFARWRQARATAARSGAPNFSPTIAATHSPHPTRCQTLEAAVGISEKCPFFCHQSSCPASMRTHLPSGSTESWLIQSRNNFTARSSTTLVPTCGIWPLLAPRRLSRVSKTERSG